MESIFSLSKCSFTLVSTIIEYEVPRALPRIRLYSFALLQLEIKNNVEKKIN